MEEQRTTPAISSVAAFIDQQIEWTEKSLVQIAEEVGFAKPNIISMIRKGNTKLPTGKVRKMALALEVDPVFMLQMVMMEYDPETWEVIQEIIKKPAITGMN